METKRCPRCKETKPLAGGFSLDRAQGNGRATYCKKCVSEVRKLRRHANTNGLKDKEKLYKQISYPARRDRTPMARIMLRQAKKSDRTDVCTITEEWIAGQLIQQGWRCYYSGVQLEDVKGKNHPFKPSLDRKDPAQGYTPENVVVCAWIINRMKNSIGHDEFLTVLSKVADSVFAKMWSRAA